MFDRICLANETIRELWVGENTIQRIVRNERDRERVHDGAEGRIGASRVALLAYTKAELCGSARSSLFALERRLCVLPNVFASAI